MHLPRIFAAATALFATQAEADIACVQEVLAMHRYDPGPIDGVLGPRTRTMAQGFAADNDITLPPLTTASSDDWCAAFRLRAQGAGGVAPSIENAQPGAAADTPWCRDDPPPGYAAAVTAPVMGDPLTLLVSDQFAGAVGSVTWRGREFINIFDHGRQISFAWFVDGWGECLNPTEPGAAADNFAETSSSDLLRVCSDNPARLTTLTRPAYWLAPEQPAHCDNGFRRPAHKTVLSDDRLEKAITLNAEGLEGVIRFDAAITLAKDHGVVQFEIPTGYLTGDFTARYRYDPRSDSLTEAPAQDPVAPWTFMNVDNVPPILATPDGAFAMGAYSPERVIVYEILEYAVANPDDHTNKWNIIVEERPAPAGTYDFQSYAIVGTLDHVRKQMQALARLYPIDFTPPTGYLDVADCDIIAGWAWDADLPNKPITVALYATMLDTPGAERRLLYQISANAYRTDLDTALGDNGFHAFEIPTDRLLPPESKALIEAEALPTTEGAPPVKLGAARVDCR